MFVNNLSQHWVTSSSTLVIISALMISNGSHAFASGINSGNDFFEICRALAERQNANETNVIDQAYCQGFTKGAWDSVTMFEKGTICTPLNVTLGQVVDISYNWLKNHPERRQNSAISAISNALLHAFPCK